tara:strand:- start:3790 stop:4212 length:423 start_codon:yes stop_codon:yes gene_type:complete
LSSEELKKLQDECHSDLSIQDFNNMQVPCIGFDQKKFDGILAKVSGKPLSVDTNLNILQDGLGHVFVEISLTFSYGGIKEKILVNANEHLIFFRLLAENLMLAIAAKNSPENIFMIQLPKPERAIEALDIIKNGLKTKKD